MFIKSTFSFILLCSVLNTSTSAQTTLPNTGMENWTQQTSLFGNYDEPDGVWATANKIVRLGFPATTFKTTDAQSGTYAAKMITTLITIISPPMLASGTLATGFFNELETPPNNLKIGTPFIARPEKFTGYYKYTSVNGDSCAIYAVLFKWNAGLGKRDTVGKAILYSNQTVQQYTKFDIPFVYLSSIVPDTIGVVFASSAAGGQLLGSPGSTLYIDNIALEMPTGVRLLLMPEAKVSIYPNPATDRIRLEIPEFNKNGVFTIMNSMGDKINSFNVKGSFSEIELNNYNDGVYYYYFEGEDVLPDGGTFIIQH